MRIELLEEFAIFAKHLNFSKAAAELNLTQPALSKHVASLEKELGVRLVERSTPLKLSREGTVFLDHARAISQTYRREIGDFRRMIANPPLRLLWFDYGTHYDAFLAENADIPFEMVLSTGHETYFSELDSQQIDVLSTFDISCTPDLAREAENRGISIVSVGTERGALMVSKNHPLAGRQRLRHVDLRGVRILMPDRGLIEQWQRCLTEMLGVDLCLDFVLRPIYGNLSNLKHMPLDDGIYFDLEKPIRGVLEARSDAVLFDELDGAPIEFPLALLYRKDNQNSNVELFIERAVEFFKK